MATYKERAPALSGTPEEICLRFRFQINGTSNPDFLVGCQGLISDVVRDDVGDFSVVFNLKYSTMVNCHITVEDSVGDMIGVPVSWTGSTGTLALTTFDTETPAAADPTDDSWVHVTLTLCRRSQLAPTVAV